MEIIIRKGALRDLPHIRSLAVRSVHNGIPHTRRVDPEHVRRLTAKALSDLELSLFSKSFELIVAEDVSKKKIAGYLMLVLDENEESTGEPQSLIHDLAVEPEYMGKFVVDMLMSRAEEITRQKGLKYIVGSISVSNKRAWLYATKRLKYEIERYQIVKVLLD